MAEFTDASLSPRARTMALWLCDLANPAVTARGRDASSAMLLREVPDFWTAAELEKSAREVRQQVGPKASHRAWLNAMGWLVGEEERLPVAVEGPSRRSMHFRVQNVLADVLRRLEARPYS
jgi:hypothetical protein